ncbi:MAG: hypothetical protein AAB921_03665 [Patescibacteria group bacterium]
MPDKTISFLSAIVGGCVVTYIALVIVTVTFAAVQTDLALSVRDTETEIGMIETSYYEQVGALAAVDPSTMNLHKPHAVTYATLAQAPSLSLR